MFEFEVHLRGLMNNDNEQVYTVQGHKTLDDYLQDPIKNSDGVVEWVKIGNGRFPKHRINAIFYKGVAE